MSATSAAASVVFMLVVAASASATFTSASAAFAAHQLDDAFHFFVGGVAHFHDGSFK